MSSRDAMWKVKSVFGPECPRPRRAGFFFEGSGSGRLVGSSLWVQVRQCARLVLVRGGPQDADQALTTPESAKLRKGV